MAGALSFKKASFVKYFAETGDPVKAAKMAGYAHPVTTSARLMGDAAVRAAISERLDVRRRRASTALRERRTLALRAAPPASISGAADDGQEGEPIPLVGELELPGTWRPTHNYANQRLREIVEIGMAERPTKTIKMVKAQKLTEDGIVEVMEAVVVEEYARDLGAANAALAQLREEAQRLTLLGYVGDDTAPATASEKRTFAGVPLAKNIAEEVQARIRARRRQDAEDVEPA